MTSARFSGLEALEQCGGDGASHTIAAIHNDLHWPRQLDVADDFLNVGTQHISTRSLALTMLEVAGFSAALEILNCLQRQRRAADDHL